MSKPKQGPTGQTTRPMWALVDDVGHIVLRDKTATFPGHLEITGSRANAKSILKATEGTRIARISLVPDEENPEVWAIVDKAGRLCWVDRAHILAEAYPTRAFAEATYHHARVLKRPRADYERRLARFDATDDKEGISRDEAMEAFSYMDPEEVGERIQTFIVVVMEMPAKAAPRASRKKHSQEPRSP